MFWCPPLPLPGGDITQLIVYGGFFDCFLVFWIFTLVQSAFTISLSLAKNENAQNYFNPDNATKTIQVEKLIPFVTEKLMDLNANPKGNPYVGQDQIGANKFIINKVKVLNHRWIIADFSDGEYWGEVLIKYFINDDETVSFETFQSLLYQK